MDKTIIYKLCKASYNLYVQDYKEMLMEDGDYNEYSLSVIINDNLIDKNFTTDEIKAITDKDFSNYDIMCKFIAYVMSLNNSYETIEQLNKSITELFGFMLDQDDLEHIIAKYNEFDF